MGDAKAAERARRYRRHRQGDHSLCLVGNCSAVTVDSVTESVMASVTSGLPVPPSRPSGEDAGLGDRGQRLWDDMTTSWKPSPIHREQLLELCRMADRLEKLDRQLKGEDWLRFWSRTDDGSVVEVYVDKVLSEARELASAFRALGGDLVKAANATKAPGVKGGGKLASVTALVPTVPAAR